MLLLHGQPGQGEDWEPVPSLLEVDHRVLVVDRPGYGASRLPATSMVENAALAADVIAGRAGGPAVVVGHSYGGGIALLLAARHPDVVAGLVLAASVGRAGSVSGVDRLLALPVVGTAFSAAGLFALGRVLPPFGALSARLGGHAAAWLQASLPDRRYSAGISQAGIRLWRSFVTEQRALLSEIAAVETAAASVRVPTAVVTGTWDVVVPPTVAVGLAAAVPGAELVTVARTGHFLPRDAPGVLATAVRRTWERAGG